MDPHARLDTGTGREHRPILIIDQDRESVEILANVLSHQGHAVITAASGEEGLELFRREPPALVLLDLVLPRLSGFDVCRILREQSSVHVMVLTAKSTESDVIAALEVGADDYVTKPYSLAEVSARVRAQLRRVEPHPLRAESDVRHAGPVALDLGAHEVYVRGHRVDLPPKEFELLAALIEGGGRLRTRHFLIGQVWGADYYGDPKTLDVHVKRLRRKIERNPARPEHIVTVRGLGYRFLDQPLGLEGAMPGGLRLTRGAIGAGVQEAALSS